MIIGSAEALLTPFTDTVLASASNTVKTKLGYLESVNVTSAEAERRVVSKNRVKRLYLFIIVKFTLLVWGGNVCVA